MGTSEKKKEKKKRRGGGGGGNDGEIRLEVLGTEERENRGRKRLMCFWEGCWQKEKVRNERGVNPG